MKKGDFSLSILNKKEISEMCSVCGENDYRILRKSEKHHVFGKENSSITTLLCPNCHAKITSKQNMVSPKKRKNKFAFKQISHGKLIELIGLELQRDGLRMLENG